MLSAVPETVVYVKLASLNTSGRDVWRSLSDHVDVALLQEAGESVGSVGCRSVERATRRTLGWEGHSGTERPPSRLRPGSPVGRADRGNVSVRILVAEMGG